MKDEKKCSIKEDEALVEANKPVISSVQQDEHIEEPENCSEASINDDQSDGESNEQSVESDKKIGSKIAKKSAMIKTKALKANSKAKKPKKQAKKSKETSDQPDFFFARSCFRIMTEYFKVQFQSYHQKYLKSKQEAGNSVTSDIKGISKDDMYDAVQGFIEEMFGANLFSQKSALSKL